MPARSTRSSGRTQAPPKAPPNLKKEEDTKPTPAASKASRTKADSKAAEAKAPAPTANSRQKRKRDEVKEEVKEEPDTQIKQEDAENTVHGLDVEPPSKKRSTKGSSAASKPKTKKPAKPAENDLNAGADLAKSLAAKGSDVAGSPSKSKATPYGLSPGQSPYPSYPHPTREECEEVNSVLEKKHGRVQAPKTIPQPSLESSGCGEVPSVIDALIRTRLSAATNGANSSRAFRGLVEKFGVIKQGVGKGSVNWEKVRTSPNKDVFEAIKSGGLAVVKSRDIQLILNMVLEENDEARKTGAESDKVPKGILSLDHLHKMGSEEAFAHLLRYPGIGPKTASCVLLFCMQRPSFAVDTHVFRLTRWLGWMPTDAQARAMAKRGETKSGQVTRNSTYAHLDVRIPDELKYALHYLLIRHGKECGWCSAKAGAAKRVGTCPLAHLMKGKGRSKGSAKKGETEDDVDDEEDDEDSEEEGASDAESVAVEDVVGMDSMKHE
ncbi:MAG: hypothetical protein M1828_004516 [Chrysothrix sp. TS-e1954]|nr:MAG: hypothetical protein M1828_004516 [Chrysothrix sp. TS-e1954]